MNLRSQSGLRKFVEAHRGQVAFLRFERGGLKQGRYSDWDIAVRDRSQAMAVCDDLYGQPWLRIPRQYVIQYFFPWGQCDLLPVFEWNGIEYLDQKLFWSKVSPLEDGIPRPALGHDAYIAWMTGLLWGRRFNRRYRKLIMTAAKKDEANFRECLTAAFGRNLAEKLYRIAVRGDAAVATHWVSLMRLTLASRRASRAPVKTLTKVLSHWRCEFGFHRQLPLPWLGILGPDGSGKSTVIEGLNERLRLSRLKIRTIHWLPKLSPDVRVSTTVVTDPHGEPPKSALLSYLQLGKIISFWWWANLGYLLHLRAKKEMVLSDRFYPDLLADPRRYRYGGSLKIARLAFKLIPRPDRVVVLHTEAETILRRKQEVSPDELKRQLDRYQEIADEWSDRAKLVDCGQEVEAVVEQVLEIALEALAKRSR
ncbi:hypothetical protein N8522_03770 [Akkermansiaceae bacterium]|nr:hypothetical protein [Akkermansiaceae bacterium]MDB4813653.1 hypothetical protein [bacterium]MDB4305359.1 hypothetical protein [Akkermansiaceae bacterium]MDB4321264.1 hypothetical protein [Akkermansiaceae bacterium]MDB4411860.1 hypothetical protein [Akkermansiaceae bacterium]